MRWNLKNPVFIFGVCYCAFFFSLFIGDISFRELDVSLLAKIVKGAVLVGLFYLVINMNRKTRYFVVAIFLIFVGGGLLVFSGDFFWLVIITMGVVSYDFDEKRLFKFSLLLLLVLTVLTVLLHLVGVFPDVISYRTDFSNFQRHSIGFIHSTVLPLIVFYLLTYYVEIKKEEIKYKEILVFVLIESVLFFYCGSRNAIVFTMLLSFLVLVFKLEIIRQRIEKYVTFCAKYIVFVCILVSILPGYLRKIGVFPNFWYAFDSIFTNRSMLGAAAFNSYGISIINRMSYSDYMNVKVIVDSDVWNGIVLDSAYLYVLVRYGVVALILLWLILKAFYANHKNNIMDAIVFIVVAFANVTDNDILSYGCMPFVVLGIRSLCSYLSERQIQGVIKWKQ